MRASEIVEQIEAILKEKHIKKGDFYKACNISAAMFSNWRKNKNYPLLTTLQTINEYLGTSFVVSINAEKPALAEEDGMSEAKRALLDEVAGMNESEIFHLIDVIRAVKGKK